MSGFGFAAFGFTPFGWGDVDTAPAPATDLYIDSDNGSQQTARKIDAATGQYVLGASGRVQGMPRARQLVQLRIRTVLKSSVVQTLGMVSPQGDVGPRTAQRLANAVTDALADLVRAKVIAIVSITSGTETPTRARGALRWRDLTTAATSSGQEFTEPL